ncbi:hypothetical protein ScPMuIL_018738 [Solemya velum]
MCDAKVLADVRADISGFSGDLGAVGHALFVKMFQRPGVQDQFPKYKGKSVDSVKAEITAHGKKVVAQLVDFAQKADTSDMSGMVADFISLHTKNKIPHASIAAARDDIISTLAAHGMKSASWGAFLDFFFGAIKY